MRHCDWSMENYEATWNLSGGIRTNMMGQLGIVMGQKNIEMGQWISGPCAPLLVHMGD